MSRRYITKEKYRQVPKFLVSGDEKLFVSGGIENSMTPYPYRIEGTYCGKEWSCNLSRQGVIFLMQKLLEVL